MEKEFQSLRVGRSYLMALVFLTLCAASVCLLILTIKALGDVSHVFILAVASLLFFFLTLLYFFSSYLRVDDDRILIQHDLLRKDMIFFYDITRIEFEDEKFISIYHLNGLSKVQFSKFNFFDKKKVIHFFKELSELICHTPIRD